MIKNTFKTSDFNHFESLADEFGTWDQHDADYYDNLSKLKKKKLKKKKKKRA